MTAVALFNGAPAPDLAFNRGLHYGDGVFRTCMIYDSQVYDFDMQLDKLFHDASRLDLAPCDGGVLRAEALELARGQPRGVLKMLLLRAWSGERGYRSATRESDRLLCRYPAPSYAAGVWEQGMAVARARFRLAAQPALAGVKHLNRLEHVLAARDWPEGADEILIGDDQDHPIGGSRSNLFWARGGCLYTPLLDRCGVAGLTRDKVMVAAQAEGLPVQPTRGSWMELEQAEEVFLTSSLIGVWPVARLDARTVRAPGPITARLAALLRHPRLVAA
jgi:4-amino-4-deoxychorismate lyase